MPTSVGPISAGPISSIRAPRVGFIVTNLSRPAERVVAFYNHRGTAEQYIKEGKYAIKWTRLSCDLSGADLSKADLREANLSGADLAGAVLYEANLFQANLSGAMLYKAKLIESDLRADLGRESVAAIGDRFHRRRLDNHHLSNVTIPISVFCSAITYSPCPVSRTLH